ncbi:MAG: response regulator [Candidatus Uhrbacteria bacterium]|nr:response regulator [Candidatus Uhrbacteria bacterium]
MVDDEPLVTYAVRRMLEYLSDTVECQEAGSGQEALDFVEQGVQFDVIVSDVGMPGMTGVELHRKIKGQLQGTKFLFMSGGMRGNDEAYVRDEGIPLLCKPFLVSDLQALL